MPRKRVSARSQDPRTCVYNSESLSRTGVSPRPVGLNKRHEASLITFLVDHYGWTLCADGNLYNPFRAEESNAA